MSLTSNEIVENWTFRGISVDESLTFASVLKLILCETDAVPSNYFKRRIVFLCFIKDTILKNLHKLKR